MNIALWIVAGVLAFAFVLVGLLKVAKPKEELAGGSMPWAADFSSGAVKAIGALEVLAAVGLVLPPLLDTATVLVPLAATGLAVTMVAAAVVHARRKENSAIGLNVVLLAMAVFVAWGRFGPHSF